MLSFNLLSKIPPVLFNIVKKSGADVKESPSRLLFLPQDFFFHLAVEGLATPKFL